MLAFRSGLASVFALLLVVGCGTSDGGGPGTAGAGGSSGATGSPGTGGVSTDGSGGVIVTGNGGTGNLSSGGAGGKSPGATVPDAYVSAAVGPLANSAACPLSGIRPFVTIGGGSGSPKPTTVSDGSTQAAGTVAVHVSCTVSAAGDGFDVHASASTDGQGGGALTITGHVNSAGGQDLSASFTQPMFGTFSQTGGCTIEFVGNPTPISPAVAAGHIWGRIRCFGLQKAATTSPNSDGGPPMPTACDGLAYFLFEGCGT